MIRYFLASVSVFLLALFLPPAARADWHVVNNLPEPFTIIVYPANGGNATKVKLARNETRGIKLGTDRHTIKLISQGGNQYKLRPTELLGRQDPDDPTELKTILTPDGRDRDGDRKYKYMNQDGFREAKN